MIQRINSANSDQRPQQKDHHPSEDRNVPENRQGDSERQIAAMREKDALKGVETDEAIPVVGFDHKKHDGGNQ